MRRFVPALIAAPLLALSPSLADDAATADAGSGLYYVEYTGSVYFLQVAEVSLSARFEPETYSSSASFQSAGLLRWFDDTDIQATATGYRTDAGLAPFRYEHLNRASEKGRTVGIDFPDGMAMPVVDPPFGSMGEPPASEIERTGALDPISVILSVMTTPLQAGGPDLCNTTLPVFDGKARYDLRFENLGVDEVRTRAYRGDAIRCQAYLEPISGYDPGDRPTEDEIASPVNIWFVEMGGLYMPVRFRAATQIGNISLEARRLGAGGETL